MFFFLSVSGYQKLGLEPPADPAFTERMRNRELNDPSPDSWDGQHKTAPDALLIVADDSDTKVANAAARLTSGFAGADIEILGMDAGRALRAEPKGPGLEHFGYLDGRSQPLMLTDDVAREAATDGIDQWNPAFGPGEVVLVRDPHGTNEDSFGSYLVYRKLEQNVRGFKTAEEALADTLGLAPPDRERAGATVVGRFENGTPVAVSCTDQPVNVTNNFNYALGLKPGDPPAPKGIDPDGLKCPFQGHIRKTNPRGDTVHRFGVSEADERSHLMARRGIPFGERAPGELEDDTLSTKPTGGVGLLFMAYNKDIELQFEFTQRSWVNNPGFVTPDTGIDPIIGQGATPPQLWRASCGTPASEQKPFTFEGFVKMRGGEYFFAPSVGFLRTLT